MNVVERAKAPTPKFFKILRTVGLTLLAISGSVIAAPIVLPATVVTVAGYLAVAGGVISAVSQITVDTSTMDKQDQTLSPSTPLRMMAQDKGVDEGILKQVQKNGVDEVILKQVQDKNSGRDPEINSG